MGSALSTSGQFTIMAREPISQYKFTVRYNLANLHARRAKRRSGSGVSRTAERVGK